MLETSSIDFFGLLVSLKIATSWGGDLYRELAFESEYFGNSKLNFFLGGMVFKINKTLILI
jgi:hypothetical protein